MTEQPEEDHRYHTERARAELDAAYRAEGHETVAAHLRRCSFHMQRARDMAVRAPAAKELEWIDGFAPLHERALLSA